MFLQQNIFGENEWAFRPGLDCKDLVTMLVMSWILGICSGKKIGIFLNDITGAFEGVFKIYLIDKLYAADIASTVLNFWIYLAERQGKIVVQETSSDSVILDDQVWLVELKILPSRRVTCRFRVSF